MEQQLEGRIAMVEQEYHEMFLESVHPSREEEWHCPTCGRRFLMQWPPAYSKVVLEPGDESAIHSGSKGMGRIETAQDIDIQEMLVPDTDPLEKVLIGEQDKSLQPYIEWLEKIDFVSLWKEG
jgi:hypothetical protein